jgi:hypothetical protein
MQQSSNDSPAGHHHPERIGVRLPEAVVDGFDVARAFAASVAPTGTSLSEEQVLKRLLKIGQLIKLLRVRVRQLGAEHTPSIAETGVWRGLSARVIALAVADIHIGWAGDGLHLVDSFEGLGEPSAEDTVLDDAGHRRAYSHLTNFESSPEVVRQALSAFPEIGIHTGWIPGVLADLPDQKWDFVHLDTDHYLPVRDSLEYFLSRMAPGGIIVNDDYGSTFFPGARIGWDEVREHHGLKHEVFETGQAAIIVDWL